ncbi:MAG TPA: type II toxin-antitoxin system prevent-host-death family antitoxin [Edaphobacter sp.]|uniref:type II toxin-antitoxin system Phd/YefM family antitoxin n=1 Tax=Edaphobacter sp. TaxID=1934404 RepID=UPI002BC931B9|nr:type II toxin-antitoxin system prevent-host-death family antitoxin [Edaphobacter sp.]HUZ96685.1 type II toxin-antitoxin system prevent-host-death family antitoxin [Edaphobacter sp.]
MSMKSVGIRDLKNKLSEYVREVRSGEAVLVTDRGEVVAELIPPGPGDERGVPSALLALARRGHVTLGVSNDAPVYPKLPRLLKRNRAVELLNEERGAQ